MAIFEITHSAIEEYLNEHSKIEPPLQQKVRYFTRDTLPEGFQMLSGPLEGNFLKMVVMATGAKSILELGTFTGYSCLWMADGLIGPGEILTCELSPQNAKFARTFFDMSPHKNIIRIIQGPALESVIKLQNEKKAFDLVFIDADKKNYPEYYERCLSMLKTGGHMIIDNTLWGGEVTAPTDTSGFAIHELNVKIAQDRRVDATHLPLRDGIQWIRKK